MASSKVGSKSGRRAGLGLRAAGLGIALLFALPLLYLVVRAFTEEADLLSLALSGRSLAPAARSVLLGISVAVGATLVGTSTAWLVARTDLPGRRLWRVVLPLPLVFPSFVGAFVMLAAFAPGGLVSLIGFEVGRIDGFVGSLLVLTVFTYPYVYLPVAARIRGLPPSLEESARLLGLRPLRSFWTVVIPQIADAMVGGALLVFLYTISDFGVVQLMRFPTLTRSIYANRLFDRPTSIALSLLLAALALVAVAAERFATRRLRKVPSGAAARPFRIRLGKWKAVASAFVAAVVALSLAVPIGVLAWWVIRSLTRGPGTMAATVESLTDLWGPTLNTAAVSLAAALVAVVLILPVAYLTSRGRSRSAAIANAVVLVGFALPGLALALALVFWTLGSPGLLGWLYQSLPLLILAYVLHFGAHPLRTTRSSLLAMPERVEDAARTLGASRWRRLIRVELPLIGPGMVAGAGLVLLSVMKELPATLLLAPAGFSTLAVEVWQATESALFAQASLAALVLVALSGILTWWLVIRRSDGAN